ncbi:MAG: dTMP kinase [Halothiobacillaceae bacterium]|nr:MAG: dTMP kinase [Halothiobacillaceae bacterium]
MQGHFITVEGIEGVGKSSNIAFIQQYLEEHHQAVVLTREPGGTALGEQIRDLLLGHRHDGMCNATELLLMFAARAEHLDKVILPHLQAGRWVLCDRFTDATYAYQGGGRGMSDERIGILESWVQGTLRPDLTLLLDAPVDVALGRAQRRSEPDRFERSTQAFFAQVRTKYLELAQHYPQRYRLIDASQTLTRVQSEIRQVLASYLHHAT